MNQAKIFWDMENYQLVEHLLLKYKYLCEDNRIWKLNLAHAYYMQSGKVPLATKIYEELCLIETNLLDVEAILIANLCVTYVVQEQNQVADNLINRLTDEEIKRKKENPHATLVHLSIIHLVIGTLYCAHKNFEFGVDYVFKAFNPMQEKLNPDTWHYAKKCIFELIRTMAFRQHVLDDIMYKNICDFLDNVDKFGQSMEATIDLNLVASATKENRTVSYQARCIKGILLKFYEY